MSTTVHIASLLVHARTEAISDVERDVLALGGARTFGLSSRLHLREDVARGALAAEAVVVTALHW